MNKIGIVYQSKIKPAEPLSREIQAWLEDHQIEAWCTTTWDEEQANGRMAGTDLLIVLGGDGSTLHAARLALPFQVPVFGVNLGRVGFLSEAAPDNWQEKLGKVLAGDYWLEERLMLNAAVQRNGRSSGDLATDDLASGEIAANSFIALNDIVISRGSQVRIVRFDLFVDNDLVTTYAADGLIIATPTGSTAYAMAAGGPLLPPQLQNIIIVPVAAHLTLNRPLVLHEEAVIRIRVKTEHEAMLTADGQSGVPINNGDDIILQRHANASSFARVDSSGYFYRRLLRRLGFK